MSITKEKYSDKRINLIYQMLLNEKEAGNPKDYDIEIDDLKVVSRTDDTERFFNHEDFIQDDTKKVIISIYIGNSRRYSRYILLMNEEELTPQQTLSGIDKAVDDKLTLERRKWEYEMLQKENGELQDKLDDAEEYVEVLENKVSQLETEKSKSSNKLTDTIIGLAGVYLSKNSNALSGIPILSGLLGDGNKDKNEVTEEGEVTYTEQTDKTAKEYTGNVKQKDIEDLQMALIPFFNESDLDNVENIINHLYRNNNYILHVLQGLERAEKETENRQQKQGA